MAKTASPNWSGPAHLANFSGPVRTLSALADGRCACRPLVTRLAKGADK